MNLEDAAYEFATHHLELPDSLPLSAPLMTRVSDYMFRAKVRQLSGEAYEDDESKAFGLMREGLTAAALAKNSNLICRFILTRLCGEEVRFVLIWRADGQILLLIV